MAKREQSLDLIADSICAQYQLSPAIARVLVRRGFVDLDSAGAYLDPHVHHLHPTAQLRGMAEAVARIETALARREKILLYGDYDVDGTSAIVILKTVLDLLGGVVEAFVPHRILDGYGMKEDRIRQAGADGVGLIISVDTGIRAGEVVSVANEIGVDVIVTDHHLPETEIPPAIAVLNPNQPECRYPNKHLCGAGVAFKLAQGLLEASAMPVRKRERLIESLMKIAAVATVADIVPLEGENRAIVKLGLLGLADVKSPGLRALLDVSGIPEGVAPTARQVGFQIGPRINAAGRMASASEVLDLFFTRDEATARRIATNLDELNRERQLTEAAMKEKIFSDVDGDPAWTGRLGLVLFGEDWHLGVAGIVAGRVAELHRKPTFVLTQQEKDGEVIVKGSGRSILGFHLLDALESMKDLFTQFGGHEQAAGVSLLRSRVPDFIEAFSAYANAKLDDEKRRPVIEIDEVVTVPEVDVRLYEEVQKMAPFGYRNQPPVFALLGVEAASPPQLMKEKHIKLTVRQGGRSLKLKGWNVPDAWKQVQPGAKLDAAFQLEHDSFDGWSAILKDLRPAQ
ncbi:single-stranded-DNA-specific exonuclease RecJ [Bryobacter aggregatus]|uniref:single-stranded-DNA-specific exonuclease RecJ n=1 Tax=Bryobacter aggregatus TaxID=360054 RepID=UPI00056D10E1|nr:single-stranded-DNA-specific exonuclease RecJ [Bryobacter aggregatus]